MNRHAVPAHGLRFAWAAMLAVAVAVAGCHKGAQGGSADDAFRALAEGDSVPAYAVATLTGDTARFGTGQPVTLLNIWATWCTSCREEMSDLVALHEEFGGRGLRIVAVSVDQGDREHVARFAQAEKLTFPVGLDPSGQIEQQYSVVAVPTSFLIGADGRLLWKHSGNLHPVVADARARVMRAVASAAAPPGG